MLWFIRKWLKKLEETTKDPSCCDIHADIDEIFSVLENKGYNVDVFIIRDVKSFLKAMTIGIKGIILEEYRGEDIAAVRTYEEREKVEIQNELKDGINVQKRLHLRFWKMNDNNYRVKAHTEFDVTDPRHALNEGINYDQGCEWFRKDVQGTDIKIILS